MLAAANDTGLVLCEFADRPMSGAHRKRVEARFGVLEPGDHPVLAQTDRELREYFAGQREIFTIPIVLGGTPFQASVWAELLRIPWGKTVSYDWIASRLSQPFGARAVGRANGHNRIAIIVPCHRVINSDGGLSGYGGGRHRKRWLLAHEARGVQLTMFGGDDIGQLAS
jgi:AraC family transcriptional regulator, regulatory protein of adaptative response / methylated-DNA-[protein]-cysteine methyltransferase